MRWLFSFMAALWISLWLFYAMSYLIHAQKTRVGAERIAVNIVAPSRQRPQKNNPPTSSIESEPPPPPAFSPPPPAPLSLPQPQLSLSAPNLSLPKLAPPQLNSRPFISAPLAAPAPKRVAAEPAPATPQLDQELVPLLKIPPRYPRRAARAGKEGWVKLELSINEKGSVSSVKIIDSRPKGLFDRAAKRAVLKWKFRPKMVNGRPVPRKAIQLIEFKLKK